MRRFLLIPLLCIASASYAQKVFITKVDLAGDKIIVHYELEDSNPSNEYLLQLYSSHDGFASPLLKVSGDVGGEIKPGVNKKMEWNIREELGNYKGKLSLEIKGKSYVPIVKLEHFDTKKGYKRGKSYQIIWKSGAPGGQVNIDLYKGSERISGERNLANSGSFTWHVPKSTKPGKGYTLRFTDTKNNGEAVVSPEIKIIPKVPIWMKAFGVLAVGGGAYFIFSGGSSDPGTDPTSNAFTDPPFPN